MTRGLETTIVIVAHKDDFGSKITREQIGITTEILLHKLMTPDDVHKNKVIRQS
jgi:hypothetical protein